MATISPTGQRGRAIGLIALMALARCAPAQGSEPAAGYELTIRNTNPGQNFSPPDLLISAAAMLSLTNDGFVAARSIALPEHVGASTTAALRAYDAGSEANTESCAHVPCEIHDQRMTEGAEGVVTDHAGIRGDADIALSRGWDGAELGTLTITRLR